MNLSALVAIVLYLESKSLYMLGADVSAPRRAFGMNCFGGTLVILPEVSENGA